MALWANYGSRTMTTKNNANLVASLDNPFAQNDEQEFRVPGEIASTPGPYEE